MMRWRAVGAGVVVVVVLVAVSELPLGNWLDAAQQWIHENPVSGGLAFVAYCIVGGALMVPGSLLTVTAGYLFGLYYGAALAAVGCALGAGAGCVVSRTLARGWLSRKFANDRRFHAIDKAIESRGLFIVMLTRLSLLMPYNVMNMIYGLTRVHSLVVVFGTLVGMFPAVLLYAYLGSIARSVDQILSGELQTGTAGKVLFVVGLLAVVTVTVVIHRTATRALRAELEESSA